MSKSTRPDSAQRFIAYESDEGVTIWLCVPWGSGSGYIPPPFVRFTELATGEIHEYAFTGRTQ